jgi:hypothetical protein
MKQKLFAGLLVVFAVTAVWAAVTMSATSSYNIATTCNTDGTKTVQFDYTINSSSAGDTTVVLKQFFPDNSETSQTIKLIGFGGPDNWTVNGRNKTFTSFYTIDLAPGNYTFQICAIQQGANGNPDKQACATQMSFTVVPCTTPVSDCGASAPHGEIVGNQQNVCTTKQVNVQWSGDFGDSATLNITSNKQGQLYNGSITHEGDSCQYHLNWDSTAGTPQSDESWTFTINGNNKTDTFSVSCN